MIETTLNIRPKVLLADDDSDFLDSTTLLLQKNYEILQAQTVDAAKKILSHTPSIDVVVTDLDFKGQPKDGLALLDWIQDEHASIPTIVLSGDSETARVVGATKRRLVNFIPKCSESKHLKDLKTALDTAVILSNQIKSFKVSPERFKTKCPKILRKLEEIDRLALKNMALPTIIHGETGTGKEWVAKHIAAIYKKKLVPANMSNFGTNSAESELFGHVKGSFTGATSDKAGLIEQAHHGIFFLDELGDCPLDVQAKILRTLNSGELRRFGSTQLKQIDVHFIAATNKNLEAMIDDGRFRSDLYERLAEVVVELPPLRERPEDIEYYIDLYLKELSKDESFALTAGGLQAALMYSWPGNARELWKFVRKTVSSYPKKEIDATAVELWMKDRGKRPIEYSTDKFQPDRDRIIQALTEAKGSRTKASKILGVDFTTVMRQIDKFGLNTLFPARRGRPSK